MKLRIEKAIYGGAGLGRVTDLENELAGKAIFVPFTLRGELVEAAINKDKQGYSNADLEGVLEAAPERIAPGCEYFGRCGGCHYQHADYPAQLAMKQAIVVETLLRAKILEIPAIEVMSSKPWEYRNRIRLLVNLQSKFAVGYREQRSHAMVAISHCPIASPLLQRAIHALNDAGAPFAGLCDQIELFSSGADDSLIMTLLTSPAKLASGSRWTSACETLRLALPELHGAAAIAEQDAGRIFAKWGDTSLLYAAAGFKYQVSVGSFFQVNRFLVDGLTQLVTQARRGKIAWDLYAGVGLFARALTAGFEQVIAVESATSHADLEHNLTGTSSRTVRSMTDEFLKHQLQARTKAPELIVVDPPRAGLGAEVCGLLGRAAGRELVYVSCDPATMSRDMKALLQSGYSLQSLTLVDLFPQTFHMEMVAVLVRR